MPQSGCGNSSLTNSQHRSPPSVLCQRKYEYLRALFAPGCFLVVLVGQGRQCLLRHCQDQKLLRTYSHYFWHRTLELRPFYSHLDRYRYRGSAAEPSAERQREPEGAMPNGSQRAAQVLKSRISFPLETFPANAVWRRRHFPRHRRRCHLRFAPLVA
jgi:hypothetical protein